MGLNDTSVFFNGNSVSKSLMDILWILNYVENEPIESSLRDEWNSMGAKFCSLDEDGDLILARRKSKLSSTIKGRRKKD